MDGEVEIDEEDLTATKCVPLNLLNLRRAVEVGWIGDGLAGQDSFLAWPVLGPLLFQNESSDARDHLANERTFLSYLRLSVYMAVVSTAIVLSFHLKSKPSDLELRMATPLGAIFWTLSVLGLMLGVGNYIRTVNMYSRKAAIVQTGPITQTIMGIIAAAIVVTCIALLVIARLSEG